MLAFDRVWDSADTLTSARVQLTSVNSHDTPRELEGSDGKPVSGSVIEACGIPPSLRRADVAWSGGEFRGMEYRHRPQPNVASLNATSPMRDEEDSHNADVRLRLHKTPIVYRQILRSGKMNSKLVGLPSRTGEAPNPAGCYDREE